MRTKSSGVLLATTLATTAAAQTPAPVGAAQAPATVQTAQQAFDAAVALDRGKDAAAALAAWTALERRGKPGSRTHAIALVRKGGTLFRLARYDEAAAAVRAGLAGLPVSDKSLEEDRMTAHRILGDVARDTLDYAGAAGEFAQAEALAATPTEKAAGLLPLIEAQTFTDPAAARVSLARADALLGTVTADKRVAAMFVRARTVLLLNIGDIAGAKASALRAVTLLGGLTERTDILDVSARSDAAIAFLLGGNPDEARRYMAYTGAGRLPKGQFDPAAEMRAPDCGGEAGLKPDDVAVVEFSIASDGTIARAAPVYAAGGGEVALEFARTVRTWSWPAETVAALPPFFRYNARVEMRCSTAFQRPSVGANLDGQLEQWLEGKGVAVPDAPENAAAALAAQRTAAAGSSVDLRMLAALYRLATNPVLPRDEAASLYARALPIAVANGAPAAVRLALDLPTRTTAVKDLWKPGAFAAAVTPLLREPAYAQDPQARAAVRLMLADAAVGKERSGAATALLRQVADDPGLKPTDPLRVGALVRIASIEEQNGAPGAARATFAATGLAANQCAVMDAPPRMISGVGSADFPLEALRWGFEGWAQVQFDIAADGRTRTPRALLSYPPFVFSKAGTTFFEKARYAKTFRPDGELGCGGTSQRIRFQLGS